MNVLAGSRHLGDDDLIRYMDHQLDREGQRLMGAHLRTCAACTTRLDGFQQKAALAREWLDLLPAEMPDPGKRAVALAAVDRARFRRRGTGVMATAWVKAAAAVVLLVSVGLATEPMRGIVARGVVQVGGGEPGSAAARIAEWLGHKQPQQQPRMVSADAPTPPPAVVYAPETETPAAAPARTAARPAATVKRGMSPPLQFTPNGPDVSLQFSSVQAAGTATIWIREVPRASIQAVRGYGNEEMAPTDTGLVVRNRPGSRAEYVITVPSRYRYIRVRVADGLVGQIATTKSKQEWLWTISLKSSALDEPVPEAQ
jgi:anti-sigma factor RsiW